MHDVTYTQAMHVNKRAHASVWIANGRCMHMMTTDMMTASYCGAGTPLAGICNVQHCTAGNCASCCTSTLPEAVEVQVGRLLCSVELRQ